jgi:hypothetical protein
MKILRKSTKKTTCPRWTTAAVDVTMAVEVEALAVAVGKTQD